MREKMAVDKSFQRCCHYRCHGKGLQKERAWHKREAHKRVRNTAKQIDLEEDSFVFRRATGWDIV